MNRSDNSKWIHGVFSIKNARTPSEASKRRDRSLADFKFHDTSLGGNPALNPDPQFTKYADPTRGGMFADQDAPESRRATLYENENNLASTGLGEVYSQVLDDNAQYIHMRMGVAKYSGSVVFFANMYDRSAALLARDGIFDKFMHEAGQAAGLIGAMMIIGPIKVVAMIVTSQLLKTFLGSQPSKYYYLKPAMHAWMMAFQRSLDEILVHKRLVPFWDPNSISFELDASDKEHELYDMFREMSALLPDIWKSNGKFDAFKMINRYQVLSNYHMTSIRKLEEKATGDSIQQDMFDYIQSIKRGTYLKEAFLSTDLNMGSILDSALANPQYNQTPEEEAADQKYWEDVKARVQSPEGASADVVLESQVANEEIAGSEVPITEEEEDLSLRKFWDGIVKYTTNFQSNTFEQGLASLRDGDQWITFKVDAKNAVTDSFTNSTRESSISGTLNSLSSTAKDIDFTLMGGKTGFDPVDAVTSGVKSFLGGMLSTLHVSGLAAIYGSSVIDIPEMYDASQANLHTESFTIKLRSPFGNDLAAFQRLDVPLMALLSIACPLSTGKQTYTSPFLVELYARGRQQIRLGIIDSMTISRGTGNVGWRADGRPLGIDVTFNVKDLSKVVHMPLTQHPGWWDDANKYTDYMATLSAVSLADQVYATHRIALNFNRWKQSWKSTFMSGRITSSAMDWWAFDIMRGIADTGARTLL